MGNFPRRREAEGGEDVPDIFQRLQDAGMTSVQSGMDNVRNITGSPVAGIDANELIDTRELIQKVQDMITNKGNVINFSKD